MDETRTLKEKGLGMIPKGKTLLEAFEILDHFQAYEYLLKNLDRPLTEELLKETHRLLTEHTLSYKTQYDEIPSNPGEYTTVDMCAGDTIFGDHEQLIKQVVEMETVNKDIEFQALQAQINPHFLFNMLNNANILVKDAPDEASQILGKLDDLLRYQLNDSTRREVFLSADIQFLTSFLELEKVRRDHFEYTIFQEGNMENICIPPLLFIPFVENAVKHNSDSDHLSYVHLYFSVHDKQLMFRCENSKPRIPVKREGGIGLANVRRRLDLLYESKYTLQIEDKENNL